MADLKVVGDGTARKVAPQAATVPLTLGELLPLVAHAHHHRHAWLADLADDQVLVTADLAELLARFRQTIRSKGA